MRENRDAEIRVCIKQNKYPEIKKKAESLGLKPGAYLRMLAYKDLRRSE